MQITIDQTALQPAILALGETHFPRVLIAVLNSEVPADHVALFKFDADLVPHLSCAASRSRRNIAQEAGRLYERFRFYRYDPGRQQLRTDTRQHGPILFRLRAQEIRDHDYRTQIYIHYGLIERVSLIQHVGGYWLALNLYRSKTTGPFTRGELHRLRELSALIMALACKHVSLLTPQTHTSEAAAPSVIVENFLAASDKGLSERERAVCARTLHGASVKAIALQLGIKPSTVATLRRRAYAKLNISSLNDLFALCLASLARE